MIAYFFTDIPTWKDGEWTKTSFDTQEEFYTYLDPLFKEPGKYEFDETSFLFNAEAIKFREQKFYCDAPYMSKDYTDYWDTQKERCRKGVIFIHGEKTWFITREYYMWLNFLPINNKETKRFDFPTVRDAQYHIALYEILAELNYENVAIIKKRQIASSYFHCGRFANKIWFEETPILKLGASEKRHVNEEGDWKFLDEYRNFLNEHTAWYRPMNPSKPGLWQQQIEIDISGRKTKVGLKGVIQMMTFEKAPEKGIGGPITEFFYDEGGNAPTADVTYRYLRPAMRSGMITTGLFIIAGSVGELEKAEPLKKFIYHPRVNGFRPVQNNLVDGKGTIRETGLFIPEQWSMPPFIDQYGNSDVEGALKALDEEFAKLKKELEPADYQLELSQRPRYLDEAFAARADSRFPLNLVAAQKRRIEEKQYPVEYLDLERNEKGELVWVKAKHLPVRDFPLSKISTEKEGCIEVWERPIGKPELGKQYVASIDPVKDGKTLTSWSLCSIFIYKLDIEVRKYGDEVESWIEPGKIVAEWTGRFDDIEETHKRLLYMLEIYNARAAVEVNIAEFVTFMIKNRKQHFLVKKSEMLFLKEHGFNEMSFQDYGWKNTGKIFENHLLNYLISFLKEELDVIPTDEGNPFRHIFGIERIPSIMAMKEMEAYQSGMNVDRLVSLSALVSYVKLYLANYGYSKRTDDPDNRMKVDKSLYAKQSSFFTKKNLTNVDSKYQIKKSAFRHFK